MEHVLSSAAIRERRSALNRQIADAKAQLADLDVAERILERFGKAIGDPRPNADQMRDLIKGDADDQGVAQADLREGLLTTRALIKSILRQSANVWMTANEIQERASAIKGQEVPMATVSPTLSNLKNAGTIVRDGLKVALASRFNENGAPAGAPDAGGAATPSSDTLDLEEITG